MFEYEGGYVLPYLIDFIKIGSEGSAFHGKINGELEPITLEEAARRVMYNFFEGHAWNVDESSFIIPENPKTIEEQSMKKFSHQVGMDILSDALEWCQEIRYEVIQEKRDSFQNLLEKEIKADTGNMIR